MAVSTRVVTGKVRLSYAHVFEPFQFDDEEPKYSVMLLVPKSDTRTIEALRAAEKAAANEGKSTKFGGKLPKELASVISDGDDVADDYPERAGHWYLTVRSKTQPAVVDQHVQPILDASQIYSGCYARVSLSGFPYKFGGKCGTSFGLDNIQKVADGEPLGGVTRAEDDFEPIEDDDLI